MVRQHLRTNWNAVARLVVSPVGSPFVCVDAFYLTSSWGDLREGTVSVVHLPLEFTYSPDVPVRLVDSKALLIQQIPAASRKNHTMHTSQVAARVPCGL